IVTKAQKRLDVMMQINLDKKVTVEYGDAATNPLNTTLLISKIANYRKTIQDTNGLLAQVDDKVNVEKVQQKEIANIYSGVLKGAVSKFGADSSVVEQLGGTRYSERKQRVRKPNDTDVPPPIA
ncbi:MAG: hypothetical protein V1781_04185, partial [Bacteroidota bacterium]